MQGSDRIKRGMWRASLVISASACMLALASPSQAESTGDQPPPPFTESSTETVQATEIDQATSPGDDPATSEEKAAVDSYLESLPEAGADLEADDLEVATLDFQDDIEAVVVSPDSGADVQAVKVEVDAENGEVSAGTQTSAEGPQATSAGPGMGSWPSWSDSPSWAIQLKLYRDGNYIGKGDFQTQRRKYGNDGSSRHDLWQVARYGRGQADSKDDSLVKKLWISSKLENPGNGQQWRQDLTNPDAGFKNCSDNGSVGAGPFSFTAKDCDEYDVWQGDVGHMRFDYDQGNWVGAGARAIAYVAGFQTDNGSSVKGNWYEFVTIKFPTSVHGTYSFHKCSAETAGEQNGTQTETCKF